MQVQCCKSFTLLLTVSRQTRPSHGQRQYLNCLHAHNIVPFDTQEVNNIYIITCYIHLNIEDSVFFSPLFAFFRSLVTFVCVLINGMWPDHCCIHPSNVRFSYQKKSHVILFTSWTNSGHTYVMLKRYERKSSELLQKVFH